MHTGKYTYGKEEKLCSRKVITSLFEKGRSLQYRDLKLIWIIPETEETAPVQTTISVGRKNFKRAVDRNRIKRLIRESWRLNKLPLYEQVQKMQVRIAMMIIFTGNKMPGHKDIENQVIELLKSFSVHLERRSDSKEKN